MERSRQHPLPKSSFKEETVAEDQRWGGRIWGRKRGTGAEVNNKGVPLGEVGGDRDGEATWETQGLD